MPTEVRFCGTQPMGLVCDLLGAPVQSLSTEVEFIISSVEDPSGRVQVVIRPFDRLLVRVFDNTAVLRWTCWSPRIVGAGTGIFKIAVTWDDQECTMCINGYELESSGKVENKIARPLIVSRSTVGPLMDAVALHREPPIDRTAAFAERSEQKRRSRAQAGKDIRKINPTAPARLCQSLSDRVENLEDALAALRAGKAARLLEVGAAVRALIANGEGNKLLQRVGGLLGARLDVYCATLDQDRVRIFNSAFPNAAFSFGGPHLSVERNGLAHTCMDIEVWLELPDWMIDGNPKTNGEVILAYANKDAAHTDNQGDPIVQWMRRVHSQRAFGDEAVDLLRAWFTRIADVLVVLARGELLPRCGLR